MKKKFISIIWGYHSQIFLFEKDQNYHMVPLSLMKKNGYECEIFALDAGVRIEDDPNFVVGTKVHYYKNIFGYLVFLLKNRKEIIYANSLVLRSLIVGLIGKNTFFYPHSYPFGHSKLKNLVIRFFYRFFTKIRVNNTEEHEAIETIKKGLAYTAPLSIAKTFFHEDSSTPRNGIVWIGNFTPIKNPLFLLELAKIFHINGDEYLITMIGDDRLLINGKDFRELVRESGMTRYFLFPGVLPPSEIKNILSQAQIYINTSHSEGQCLSVYEAALSGCLLCLPEIMAFPSVFQNNALYHRTPQDAYTNISQYVSTPIEEQRALMQRNQTMILENYNLSKIQDSLFHMFS